MKVNTNSWHFKIFAWNLMMRETLICNWISDRYIRDGKSPSQIIYDNPQFLYHYSNLCNYWRMIFLPFIYFAINSFLLLGSITLLGYLAWSNPVGFTSVIGLILSGIAFFAILIGIALLGGYTFDKVTSNENGIFHNLREQHKKRICKVVEFTNEK